MGGVTKAELPGAVHNAGILFVLFGRQIISFVRADRHDIRGSIREKDAGAGEGDFRHVMREIANRMVHCLITCGDVAGSGVVVGAEVGGDTTSFSGHDESAQGVAAVFVHDCLRRLHHHFHLEAAFLHPELCFDEFEACHQGADLFRDGHLREHDDKVVGQFTVGFREECGEEQVEGAYTPRFEVFGERFDADADEGRQGIFAHPFSHFRGSLDGRLVFFFVRAITEAVFEVDAEIFEGFPFEFGNHLFIDRVG